MRKRMALKSRKRLSDKEVKEHKMIGHLKEAEAMLLRKANVALGCWGIPAGAKPTFNRHEWFSAAKEYDVLDEELEKWLRVWWARLWLRDLSD